MLDGPVLDRAEQLRSAVQCRLAKCCIEIYRDDLFCRDAERAQLRRHLGFVLVVRQQDIVERQIRESLGRYHRQSGEFGQCRREPIDDSQNGQIRLAQECREQPPCMGAGTVDIDATGREIVATEVFDKIKAARCAKAGIEILQQRKRRRIAVEVGRQAAMAPEIIAPGREGRLGHRDGIVSIRVQPLPNAPSAQVVQDRRGRPPPA